MTEEARKLREQALRTRQGLGVVVVVEGLTAERAVALRTIRAIYDSSITAVDHRTSNKASSEASLAVVR